MKKEEDFENFRKKMKDDLENSNKEEARRMNSLSDEDIEQINELGNIFQSMFKEMIPEDSNIQLDPEMLQAMAMTFNEAASVTFKDDMMYSLMQYMIKRDGEKARLFFKSAIDESTDCQIELVQQTMSTSMGTLCPIEISEQIKEMSLNCIKSSGNNIKGCIDEL